MITLLIVLASIAAYFGIGRVAAIHHISAHGESFPYYSAAMRYAENPKNYHLAYEAEKYTGILRSEFLLMNFFWFIWLPCRAVDRTVKFFVSGGTHSIDGVIEKHNPVTKHLKMRELETRNEEQQKEIARLESEAEKNRIPDVLDELETY